MSNTPLLTVRCPQDILDGITATMHDTGLSKTQVVVDMLRSSVPSLPILERGKLPSIPAIYLVQTPSNKLLYIGQTNNLFDEWGSHPMFQQFIEASSDARVVWFGVDADSMPVVDADVSTLSNSAYNKKGENESDLSELIAESVKEAIAPLKVKIKKIEARIEPEPMAASESSNDVVAEPDNKSKSKKYYSHREVAEITNLQYSYVKKCASTGQKPKPLTDAGFKEHEERKGWYR